MKNIIKPREANKRGNVATARIVPVFLLGLIGYTAWVVTDRVCVKYLINPPQSRSSSRDTGAAIAILVIFYLLLLITFICFGRLIGTITTNPGLVPRGEQYWIEKERKQREERSTTTNDKEEALEYGSTRGYTPRNLRRKQDKDTEGFRAQEFWHKDVFVCGWDGRPPFCSTCYNYKPDRAHHCRELGRCVLKMDHFCPWVGGIVSETSFKFFIQFTGWAALFCLHALVVMAYYFAKRRSEEHGFLNVHWLLVLILSGLFFIFAGGMCASSLQFVLLNSTTIENFTRKTKIWYLAVLIPPSVLREYQQGERTDLRLITYPRPPEEQFQILQRHGATLPNESEQTFSSQPNTATPSPPQNTYDPRSTSRFPSHPAVSPNETTNSPPNPSSSHSQQPTTITSPQPAPAEIHTFAILESPPGANPFDLGPIENFKDVMGYTLLDWLFPLKLSPLVHHRTPESLYKLGPAVERMKRRAGIDDGRDRRSESGEKRRNVSSSDGESKGRKHRHKNRGRRSRSGSEIA
ncbi:Palmitoyltransferase pfa5 [Cladophialophora chaetospira]|uniref:Palmitoyltransferase n=1 Tax=Cladophialophora chaetospira TaxID=386627 RepID=A0AA38WZE8_9EURO|nr:Palmitoyltransferase pfa5 [Cladophialophora chaetospira]